VLKALGIANPQWTRLIPECPEWMSTGFKLFEALSAESDVYEVFPSASYHQLAGDRGARFGISLEDFHRGTKDMLDAYVAAFTVHEYLAGRGEAVGGGDGLGTIVLPRPVSPNASRDLLTWPGAESPDPRPQQR
jgi:predicted nuclease with RNAse H fold